MYFKMETTHHLVNWQSLWSMIGIMEGEAAQTPIWWAANQWKRHTCPVSSGEKRYNWWGSAAQKAGVYWRENLLLHYRTPDFIDENTSSFRKQQCGCTTFWLLQYSFLYSFNSVLPFPLLYLSNWYLDISMLLKKQLLMVYFDQYQMEKWEKPRSRKIFPFLLAA